MGFYKDVYQIVERIPAGKIVSYSQIAQALGAPHGARAVGWALRRCPAGLPWHRLLNAAGQISASPQSERYKEQIAMLQEEGIEPDQAGRFDFSVYGWREL